MLFFFFSFWRGASVSGNACTLPGSRPDVLGCRPPRLWVKSPPPSLPHRFKEWKFSWPCGLWLGLSTGRNLVVIGKGIITSSMFMETSNLNTCNKFCSVQKRNNVGYTSDVFIERSFFFIISFTVYGFKAKCPMYF